MEDKSNQTSNRFVTFIKKHKVAIVVAAAVLAFAIAGIVTALNMQSTKKQPVVYTEEMTVAPTTEPATTAPETVAETQTETQTVDTGFRNPLTGEMTDTDISENRPYALMLNTIAQALPQRGNSQADVLIEMTEEGGITRVMGLYQDLTGVGELGSIRSTREYYLSWVMGFDGILVHAGGDSWVLNQIRDSGYANLNFIDGYGNNAYFAFYRDQDRIASAGSEHSLFTTSDRLMDASKQLGVNTKHTTENYTHFTFAKDGDGTPKGGSSAKKAKVNFSGYKYTGFTYDEESHLYKVKFWEDPYIDERTGEQIAVSNVIILPVPNWADTDSFHKTRQKYNLAGGKGYYLSGGQMIPITWSKGDFNADKSQYGNPFVMTTEGGQIVELSVGKTYICCLADYCEVTIE